MLQHFVVLSTFLSVELSQNCVDRLVFPLTMDLLGQNYTLEGLVRCASHHFTEAVRAETQKVYIDDMCVSHLISRSFI